MTGRSDYWGNLIPAPRDLYRVYSDGVVWRAYARDERWDFRTATIGHDVDEFYAFDRLTMLFTANEAKRLAKHLSFCRLRKVAIEKVVLPLNLNDEAKRQVDEWWHVAISEAWCAPFRIPFIIGRPSGPGGAISKFESYRDT